MKLLAECGNLELRWRIVGRFRNLAIELSTPSGEVAVRLSYRPTWWHAQLDAETAQGSFRLDRTGILGAADHGRG